MSGIVAVSGECKEECFNAMLEKLEHRGQKKKKVYLGKKGAIGGVKLDWEKTCEGGLFVLDGQPVLEDRYLNEEELFRLYRQEGQSIIKELDGDFSVLGQDDGLFAARDVLGRKPLYYTRENNSIAFASEIKALQEYGHTIKTFPPGHLYSAGNGFKRFAPTHKIEVELQDIPIADALKASRELLFLAVEEILSSPGKKGIFLSGGLDSAIIAAIAAKFDPNISTFSVGLKGSADLINARRAAEYLGANHEEYVYTQEEVQKILPQVIYHLESFDVELVNSSLANFFVARQARDAGVEIALSGEGADELFGGYHFLKEHTDDGELNQQLLDLMGSMHNSGLQRVDRMAAAHSLYCCMPFLHHSVIDFALKLPVEWKISPQGEEKWILKKAFQGYIPQEIITRRKEQFGIGTGNEVLMEEFADKFIRDDEYEKVRSYGDIGFKSKVEYHYYKIFKEMYPHASIVETVNRWLVE